MEWRRTSLGGNAPVMPRRAGQTPGKLLRRILCLQACACCHSIFTGEEVARQSGVDGSALVDSRVLEGHGIGGIDPQFPKRVSVDLTVRLLSRHVSLRGDDVKDREVDLSVKRGPDQLQGLWCCCGDKTDFQTVQSCAH